jgi:colanic acid/amylovoran biosynthesis protein
MNNELFVLAGNAPYLNRGCEAIVRGTTEIIRQHFPAPEFLALSHFQSDDQIKAQAQREVDRSIIHRQSHPVRSPFSPHWFFRAGLRFSLPALHSRLFYREMVPHLKSAKAVLSIGGDNYSLDYCRPDVYVWLDDLVLAEKKPLIIWGASVGPFGKLPAYEKFMTGHLKKVTGIFVRETASLAYLSGLGVKSNVRLVADPAFLLEPVAPSLDQPLAEGAVGINLSPIMARYITEGDYKKWVVLAADIVRRVQRATQRRIYLIPHVTTPDSNDYTFLRDVLSLLTGVDAVLVPDQYSAAETKWIISRMAAFAGARMHATLAALSSGVPTLSFVYSVKGTGINKDIFGDDRYCINPHQVSPGHVAVRMTEILADGEQIKARLDQNLERMRVLALQAGVFLRELV